jgi:hypothetical protein
MHGNALGPQKLPVSGPKLLSSDVFLDFLVEEVVESVFAGHSLMERPARQTFGGTVMSSSEPDITILLDIETAPSWAFYTFPGALRRIIMNVFGNALKYTKEGSIRVGLRQASVSSKHGKPAAMVEITVEDTGKGIGEEYLRNHLFTPFSQEDRLSMGTGLGLSLVRQIVDAMGGTIRITSEANRGTIVSITVQLPRSETKADTSDHLSQNAQDLEGLQVSLCGFSNEPAPLYPLGDARRSSTSNYDMVERICNGWLRMHSVAQCDPKAKASDLVLCDEIMYLELTACLPALPLVVICRSAATARRLEEHYRASRIESACEFTSQPCVSHTVINKGLLLTA